VSARIAASTGQGRLAAVWFAGAGAVFLLVLVQTLAGKYGENTEAAWGWLMPAILPTLSLITGAIAYNAAKPKGEFTVDRLAYRVAFYLSIFYLLLLLVTLLAEPLTSMTPLQVLELSGYWLGPVQGLVGLALGAFFVSRKE
jgi:hypothetical protein